MMDFLWLSSKYALFAVANPDINVRVVQCKQNFVSSCEVENIVDLFPKKSTADDFIGPDLPLYVC